MKRSAYKSFMTFIESFVVQNYKNIYPLLEKSKKYTYTIVLKYNYVLIISFLKTITNLKTILKRSIDPFYLLNFFITKFENIFINNLLISTKFYLFKSLILSKKKYLSNKPKKPYLNSFKFITIPFYKNKLTQNFYFNFLINSLLYYPYTNLLQFYHSILPLNLNLKFFIFLNLFYFKIRNY